MLANLKILINNKIDHKKMKNIGFLITARLKSTRLPKKLLKMNV